MVEKDGFDVDLKDRKILFELDMDARKTISEIAKKVGLSKQAVMYRIKKLEEKKIIEGYYAVLNLPKLGFMYCRVFIKFQNISPEKEKELIDYCSKHQKIGWVAILEGQWDLGAVIWAKEITDIEEVVDELIFKYGNQFSEKYVSIATKIWHFQHRYLLNKLGEEVIVCGRLETPTLDDLDYKILGILSRNGRDSLVDIGQKLDESAKVIQYRIQKLIKLKIILAYRAKINEKYFGYLTHKVFLILQNMNQKKMNELVEYLRNHPNMIYITKAVGKADLEFEILMKSNIDFHKVMSELRFKFGDIIKETESFIKYDEPHINYLPMEKMRLDKKQVK